MFQIAKWCSFDTTPAFSYLVMALFRKLPVSSVVKAEKLLYCGFTKCGFELRVIVRAFDKHKNWK